MYSSGFMYYMRQVLPRNKYHRLMYVLRTGNGTSQEIRDIQDMKKRAQLNNNYSYRNIPSVNYVFINNESGFLHTGNFNYHNKNPTNNFTQNYIHQQNEIHQKTDIHQQNKIHQQNNIVNSFNHNIQNNVNNVNNVNNDDLKDYDKKLLLNMDNEESEYFISRMTYKKKNHLLTKNSFFYFGYNLDIDENSKYELNIKIKQQFKYDNYPIQMNIYGNYKNKLNSCEFSRPYDDRCFLFDSNNNNKVTVLLFCPNKVFNSVVTLDQLILYKFEKKQSEVDLLTEQIFDNIDNDTIFDEIFNSLNKIFSLTNLNIEKDVDRELAICLKKLSERENIYN